MVGLKGGHRVAYGEFLAKCLLPRITTRVQLLLLSEILQQPIAVNISKDRTTKVLQLDDGGIIVGHY